MLLRSLCLSKKFYGSIENLKKIRQKQQIENKFREKSVKATKNELFIENFLNFKNFLNNNGYFFATT